MGVSRERLSFFNSHKVESTLLVDAIFTVRLCYVGQQVVNWGGKSYSLRRLARAPNQVITISDTPPCFLRMSAQAGPHPVRVIAIKSVLSLNFTLHAHS